MRFANLTFFRKTVLFLAFSLFWLASETAFAQTDTIYQKPSLNNGMPPEAPTPPPVIIAPAPPPVLTETDKERKKREKEERADSRESLPLQDRLFTGGGFELQFSNRQSYVYLAPILGYKLTDWLAVGGGLSYVYLNISDQFRSYSFHFTGGKVFTQAMVYNNFFAHAEYELLTYEDLNERIFFPTLLLGAGYRQMISDKVGIDLMLLLDANQNTNSFYQNPVIRAGLYIGL